MKIQTTIRLPDELYKELKKKAKKRGMPLNAYLVNLLWEIPEEDTGSRRRLGKEKAQ